MPPTAQQVRSDRLTRHLGEWLGAWPPTSALQVLGWAPRDSPGWDGRRHAGIGVRAPEAGAVLSVPPAVAPEVQRCAEEGLAAVLSHLPGLLGLPDRSAYEAVFRFSIDPAPLPEVGSWVRADAPGVPEWLRPFGGEVLVSTDADGTHLAGVGIKRHTPHGHELAVVTAPAAQGRGLARALVAQAARRVLDAGAVPTYLHDPANTASARVAEAAGFPDLGWTSFGISEAPS